MLTWRNTELFEDYAKEKSMLLPLTPEDRNNYEFFKQRLLNID